MSNNTDKQDEATQALLSMQGKVEPRSMSAEFIKKHFDPVSAHSQTPGPYARGNEGLTPNIDWKARAEAAEAEIAEMQKSDGWATVTSARDALRPPEPSPDDESTALRAKVAGLRRELNSMIVFFGLDADGELGELVIKKARQMWRETA